MGRVDWLVAKNVEGMGRGRWGKERANLLNGRQIAGMGKGRVGCWAVNRARREGERQGKGKKRGLAGLLT